MSLDRYGRQHFGQVPDWLVLAGSPEAVRLYAYLWLRTGAWRGDPEPVPRAQIARDLKASDRSVSRWAAELEELGALVRSDASLQGNVYTLDTAVKGVTDDKATLDSPVKGDPLVREREPSPKGSGSLAVVRQRNPYFDALVEAWEIPEGSVKAIGSQLGKVAAFLRDAPPFTGPAPRGVGPPWWPEEIQAEVLRRRRHIDPEWEPTSPTVLLKWWHVLDHPQGRKAQAVRPDTARLLGRYGVGDGS